MESIIAIAAFLLGAGAGWFFGAKTKNGDQVSRGKYDALAQENAVLAAKCEELDEIKRERTELHERAVTAEAHGKSLEAQIRQQQEQMKLEFKQLSATIFEDISARFSSQSEKKIGDLLQPFQQRLTDFKQLVDKSFGEQGKEQRSLQNEIKRIVEMNETMRAETANLASALRGNVKAQGNWGEVMLERILEESGLRRDEDYTLQGANMKLVAEDGTRQQPDVVVNLPDGKHIIVDAKVSLLAYERYCSETDEPLREAHCKEFLKSVKAHINGLSQKAYQHNDKLQTPDFVLLFMPIEGAYSFALQQDRELHAYAWGKKVSLVCPSTLFVTLRTIASLWQIERTNRNTQEIARQGGALYDKFVGFVEDMDGIARHMARAQDSHAAAMNKLKSGNGNLIRQAEKLKELGAKASKALPKTLREEDDSDSAQLALAAEG